MRQIGNDWDELLNEEFNKDYYRQLRSFLIGEYEAGTVYPEKDRIFEALKLTPPGGVRVVILGQDPYHEPGQAHGLAFSVPSNQTFPPSLQNILKELDADLGIKPSNNLCPEGVLIPWAKQGVLLLNTVLTVRAHQAGSHRGKGWEQFTDAIIRLLAERQSPIAFILWGANAIGKKELILEASRNNSARHLIITAPHPSPLSAYRGFFGGRYFSRVNFFLEDNNLEKIDWQI